jgi:hypothetical protein
MAFSYKWFFMRASRNYSDHETASILSRIAYVYSPIFLKLTGVK